MPPLPEPSTLEYSRPPASATSKGRQTTHDVTGYPASLVSPIIAVTAKVEVFGPAKRRAGVISLLTRGLTNGVPCKMGRARGVLAIHLHQHIIGSDTAIGGDHSRCAR